MASLRGRRGKVSSQASTRLLSPSRQPTRSASGRSTIVRTVMPLSDDGFVGVKLLAPRAGVYPSRHPVKGPGDGVVPAAEHVLQKLEPAAATTSRHRS